MTTMPHELAPPGPTAAGWRAPAAAVLVGIGGYLAILSLGGPLPSFLSRGLTGPDVAYTALLLLQFGFAVLVIVGGFLVEPGGGPRTIVAVLLSGVGLPLALALRVMRLTGAGPIQPPLSLVTIDNPWLLVVLLVGSGWLLVRAARRGWLLLLGLVVLAVIPFLAIALGVGSISDLLAVMLVLASALLGAILIAGRPLAGATSTVPAAAAAVFLGGYLLLAAFGGQLGTLAFSLFAVFTGRGGPEVPGATAAVIVVQAVIALVVVVGGLHLGRGPATGRIVGSIVVLAGSVLTFGVLGAWITGMLAFPGGPAGIPFRAVFANTWFAIVLFVGIAWLLTRNVRLGWLALLGTLVLIPVPTALLFANVDVGLQQIVLFLLSGIVGAGIILAGRPLRN